MKYFISKYSEIACMSSDGWRGWQRSRDGCVIRWKCPPYDFDMEGWVEITERQAKVLLTTWGLS